MRRLYFGGSFNPIHFGHLRCAQAAMTQAGFGRVVLIPAAASPHKAAGYEIAPPSDRVAMCKLAAQSPETAGVFEVDDREIRRPPPSFTIDTVRELKSAGESSVAWLIGADQLASLPRWHMADALIREAEFVVMSRAGFSFNFERLPPEFRFLQQNVVIVPSMNISATEIRRRVRCGNSTEELVPRAVAEYIHANGLYRPAEANP